MFCLLHLFVVVKWNTWEWGSLLVDSLAREGDSLLQTFKDTGYRKGWRLSVLAGCWGGRTHQWWNWFYSCHCNIVTRPQVLVMPGEGLGLPSHNWWGAGIGEARGSPFISAPDHGREKLVLLPSMQPQNSQPRNLSFLLGVCCPIPLHPCALSHDLMDGGWVPCYCLISVLV